MSSAPPTLVLKTGSNVRVKRGIKSRSDFCALPRAVLGIVAKKVTVKSRQIWQKLRVDSSAVGKKDIGIPALIANRLIAS
jgi:hypothetical protein